MFFVSATVAAALVLNFPGTAPLVTGSARHGASAPRMKLAAGLWAPPKKSKPKSPKDDGEAQEEDLLKPRKPAADPAAKPAKRRPRRSSLSSPTFAGGPRGRPGRRRTRR